MCSKNLNSRILSSKRRKKCVSQGGKKVILQRKAIKLSFLYISNLTLVAVRVVHHSAKTVRSLALSSLVFDRKVLSHMEKFLGLGPFFLICPVLGI